MLDPFVKTGLDPVLREFGVVLDDDPKPVRAAACEAAGPLHLRLTLTEGKYHQVKRMLAAVGNRVESLHRSRIGTVALCAFALISGVANVSASPAATAGRRRGTLMDMMAFRAYSGL